MSETKQDTRIVYGAGCTWWDDIYKVGHKGVHNLPCCPHCGSVLFEARDMAAFMGSVDAYERNGHPGYRKQLEWMRGKCFPDMAAAVAAYKAAQQ